MAYDEGSAQTLRDALSHLGDVTERKMFGGLCFMLHGNMLCGVHKDGGMARVGKNREAQALEIPGVVPMAFTGRRVGGMVEFDETVLADDARLDRVLTLALGFVSALPPK